MADRQARVSNHERESEVGGLRRAEAEAVTRRFGGQESQRTTTSTGVQEIRSDSVSQEEILLGSCPPVQLPT